MKKLILGVTLCLFWGFSQGQTLFTYGHHQVSKAEFLRAYNKNKSVGPNTEAAKRQYLNLYTIFKLKVQAARDLHLDTLASLHADLMNFRTQIENNYLKDEKVVDQLVDQAFRRSQIDIHVQHFYVPVNDKMKPSDTLKLYTAVRKTYQELKKGGTDYDQILSEISREIAPVRGNDLGWITVFTVPYEFENVIYGLKPGQVSAPLRTSKGWHIFKVEAQRPAEGEVQVAQILFAVPNSNIAIRDRAKQQADSVYQALLQGADFGALAAKYSDDRRSFMNGGLMPKFGVAKYDGAFEQQAFALKNNGDISKPFQTVFGYHILKRIARFPVPADKNDPTFMADLRNKVLQDSRINLSKEVFMKEVMVKTGFRENTAFNKKDLWRVTDTFTVSGRMIHSGKLGPSTVLFSFPGEKVYVRDWLRYTRDIRRTYVSANPVPDETLLKNYISLVALENYKKRLEKFSAAFRYQMQEFEEGNLLFEVMQRKVWSRAASDSEGLEQYYRAHASKYLWGPSADAVLFSCSKKQVAEEAMQEIRKGDDWRTLIKGTSEIQADSARYELNQIPAASGTLFSNGLVTTPVVNPGDGTAVFALIVKTYPGGQPRSFRDARGLVINDYQNYLEKKWIDVLKRKYPVHINQAVFRSILKDPPGNPSSH
ncbi:MAG: peptidylprolyl isomerase [Bacteroidota bacterium]|nr:peptidylprolyl isomerase [Bacteroidota bacterium]